MINYTYFDDSFGQDSASTAYTNNNSIVTMNSSIYDNRATPVKTLGNGDAATEYFSSAQSQGNLTSEKKNSQIRPESATTRRTV
jgi:hypothetical protein